MINEYYLSREVGFALKAKGLKLAVAESCTAGGLGAKLSEVPGCSAWLERGFIVYSNESKIELLGVNPMVISSFGAVSKETVYEMAQGALNHSQAHVSLSITGLAGPTGGSPTKPVGTVWFGLGVKDQSIACRKMLFHSGRGYIRQSSILFALKWLHQSIPSIFL